MAGAARGGTGINAPPLISVNARRVEQRSGFGRLVGLYRVDLRQILRSSTVREFQDLTQGPPAWPYLSGSWVTEYMRYRVNSQARSDRIEWSGPVVIAALSHVRLERRDKGRSDSRKTSAVGDSACTYDGRSVHLGSGLAINARTEDLTPRLPFVLPRSEYSDQVTQAAGEAIPSRGRQEPGALPPGL